MDIQKIENLLNKYFRGDTTLDEEEYLRDFFGNEAPPYHLQRDADLFRFLERKAEAKAETDPMAKIEAMDINEAYHPERPHPVSPEISGKSSRSGSLQWSLRIAAGTILILVGFSAGLLLDRQAGVSNDELAALQEEVQQIKSALMYGSYTHQTSASERISALNRSTRLQDTGPMDSEILEILVSTLNNDANVNVRLAAAESLFQLRDELKTGRALALALSRQTDPMVQLTLIDMLVGIREKTAINEMQKMLIHSGTVDVVKDRLRAGIAELET